MEFAPRQVNNNKFLDYCDHTGLNPHNHYVLRSILAGSSYTSKNTIATLGYENGQLHHIAVLTSSNLIPYNVQDNDEVLLRGLIALIRRPSMFDVVFGKRTSSGDGKNKLRAILKEEGLSEQDQNDLLGRLYIQPIKLGDIHLAIAEDETRLEDLVYSLGKIAPVVGYRTGLPISFVDGLIESIR